ncbi:MAG: hypothetical protein IPH68_15450 [Chitinophagaceae bacterium]|nr:hypothetical protein [Chitinophagaceae bacterium]
MRSIIIICCFITANPVKAQMPDSVKNFIGKALNLMEQHSVFSAGLNWKNIRDTANALSKMQQPSGKRHRAFSMPSMHLAINMAGWFLETRNTVTRLSGQIPAVYPKT